MIDETIGVNMTDIYAIKETENNKQHNKTVEELLRDSIKIEKDIKKMKLEYEKSKKKLDIILEKKKNLLEEIAIKIKEDIKKIK